jgi:hypothetical protein
MNSFWRGLFGISVLSSRIFGRTLMWMDNKRASLGMPMLFTLFSFMVGQLDLFVPPVHAQQQQNKLRQSSKIANLESRIKEDWESIKESYPRFADLLCNSSNKGACYESTSAHPSPLGGWRIFGEQCEVKIQACIPASALSPWANIGRSISTIPPPGGTAIVECEGSECHCNGIIACFILEHYCAGVFVPEPNDAGTCKPPQSGATNTNAEEPPVPVPPVLTDLTCNLWPTAPGCPLPKCPPDCLSEPDRAFRNAADELKKRIDRTSIKVKMSQESISLNNRYNNPVTLTYDVQSTSSTSKSSSTIYFKGWVSDRSYQWKVRYSATDNTVAATGYKSADNFKQFIAAASAGYVPDLRGIALSTPGGGGTQMDPGTRDRIFCGSLGLLTGSAIPLAGAGIFGLCTWFASNGLD